MSSLTWDNDRRATPGVYIAVCRFWSPKRGLCMDRATGPHLLSQLPGSSRQGCGLFRLIEKFLVSQRQVRCRTGPADGSLELPPLLVIGKGDSVVHGRDPAHQVNVDVPGRLG